VDPYIHGLAIACVRCEDKAAPIRVPKDSEIVMLAHWQAPGDELDIAAWPEDEEHPFFPEGSRDKRLLRCPAPAPQPWLVVGHRYLFKKSRAVYPEQFWAEVVASRLGRITGVPVPPAYGAWDSRNGECAALIEWFWGYPDSSSQGFVSGGLFMKAMIKDFDHERGTQHNFTHVERLCHVLQDAPQLEFDSDWLLIWARMLTFDALIGNTDRHQENWGFVLTRQPGQPAGRFELSPAFDNGTSLGHERQAAHFTRFGEPAYLQRYIGKGHHHLKWQINDPRQCGHAELLLKIVEKAPQCRPVMLSVLQFAPEQLDDAVMPLCGMVLPARLSTERARFMLTLLKARRERLLEALTTL
jgi:hypothetical protein